MKNNGKIEYKYSLIQGNIVTPEREPKRSVRLNDTSTYGMQSMGQNENHLNQNGFIVNGVLKVSSDEFIPQFQIIRVGDSKVLIGSYPATEDDVITLRHYGVTGLLNFMTVAEMLAHGLDSQSMNSIYVSNEIEFVKVLPIDSANLES